MNQGTNSNPFYCSQHINIPPEFPDILKNFTKAAIKTQPKDVTKWAAAYFRAIANDQVPPVKSFIEFPLTTQKTDAGLTRGLLHVLHKQCREKKNISRLEISEKWQDVSLPSSLLDEICSLGKFIDSDIEWIQFLCVVSLFMNKDIISCLKLVCEILTSCPQGSEAYISYVQFEEMYKFIASIDAQITQETIDLALEYLLDDAKKQQDMIHPGNFYHKNCPSLK